MEQVMINGVLQDIDRYLEAKYHDKTYLIKIGVWDLTNWMQNNKIEVTEENVDFLIKAKIIEHLGSALDNQVGDKLEHIIQEFIGDPEKITDEEITPCDDCGVLMDMQKGEDFFFEVDEEHAEGKKPNIAVCEHCWTKKGYAKIYNRAQAKKENPPTVEDDGVMRNMTPEDVMRRYESLEDLIQALDACFDLEVLGYADHMTQESYINLRERSALQLWADWKTAHGKELY